MTKPTVSPMQHTTVSRVGRRATLCGALVAVALLAGCASVESGTPEEIVKARATARLKAMVAHDFKKSYEYLAPSYRAVRTVEQYSANIGGAVQWLGADVVRVQCESAEKCTARIKIDAKPLMSTRYQGTISTGVNETWLLEEGQWWLYQKL